MSVSAHCINIQSFAIKILQIKHGQVREIVINQTTGVEFQKKSRF